ncbi:hypothetical protein KR038_009994, partial [Drosophila bunnanda]
VTRARTRRMSLLDTDSRPGTPQLDTASDRGTASPRPTRRTRLNSVTLDVRTPTRSTRASLARGETPEPTTPSSVKRTARTPANTKSVRQQLTLKEEVEETEVKQVEKPSSRTYTPTGEKRVTRSMSQTPPSVIRPSSQPDLNTFPEDKQKRDLESVENPHVVEKEVKAPASIKAHIPKVSVRLEKLKINEMGRDGIVITEEIKEMIRASPINPSVVDIPNGDDHKQSVPTLDSEISQTVSSITETQAPKTVFDSPEPSDNTKEMQPATEYLPVQLPEKNDSLEEQEFLDAEKSLPVDEQQQDERVSEMEHDSKVEQQAMPNPDVAEPEEEIICVKSPKRKEATVETPKEDFIAEPENEIKPLEMPMDVDEDERVSEMEHDSKVEQQAMPTPDVAEPEEEIICVKSPKRKEATVETSKEDFIADPENEIKPLEMPMDVDEEIEVRNRENSIIISSPDPHVSINCCDEQKKVVGFNSDTKESDVEKKRFPKTPGREKAPSSFNFTPKPLKTDVDQRRNSSTPLLKEQESQSVHRKMELQPPPLQIDAIKPFDELEKEKELSLVQPANMSPKKAVTEIIALLNSDEELEQIGDKEEEGGECEFIVNEAEEAPADYQSGDSMDLSERQEIEENEIHHDGESVGSQDTEDESACDSYESNDSFVVSDDDVEEDLDPLCYSTNEEDEVEYFESKDKKKRRRILVAESSEDENKCKDQNKSTLAKSKDHTNCSSDASKLSEAAQMMNGSAEKSTDLESELENSRILALNELNKSERFNKTATRQDASLLELDSTDQEEEKEEDSTEKRNRSVFEIMDSEDDKEPAEEDADKDEELGTAAEAKSAETKVEEIVEKCTSFQTQKPSKSADELSSSDLRHLDTLFNPLQKSRRQSLIMPGHELAAKESKIKRRSDRAMVGSDFCPSQSFVEMIAEHKRIKNKRKRLSKSFSGAAEDLEEMGGICHERKRLKSSKADSTESLEDDDHPNAETALVDHSAEKETPEPDSFKESDFGEEPMQAETIPEATTDKKKENVEKNVSLKKSPAKKTLLDDSQTKEQYKPTWEAAEDKTISPVKPSVSKRKLEPSSEPRTAEYYLDYCNNVLQKANEAILKKKKEDVAAGKRQKKQKRPAAPPAGKSELAMSVLTLQTGKQISKPALPITTVQAGKQAFKAPPPPKKDLKRLQAARQAVGHAVSLLAPTKIPDKEARSLVRKLSPQPPLPAKKESKKIKKPKKQKLAETSPLKSSDEENHVARGNRFRTNAGFVTVSRIDSPPRAPIIELIKTSSGIMRVEPATPKQKYFRESPATPRNHAFQDEPASSGKSKKRAKQKALKAKAGGKQNPAMQSALRFKEQAFARKF